MSAKTTDSKDAATRLDLPSSSENYAELLAAVKQNSQRQDFPIKHIAIMLMLSFLLMFATSFGILAFATRGWFSNQSTPVIYQAPINPMYGTSVKGNSNYGTPMMTASSASYPEYVYPSSATATKPFSLEDVPNMPLTQISRNQNVALQWGGAGSGEERKYLLYVDGVSRDVSKQITTITMSSGHVIIVHPDHAVLYDRNNEELGVIDFTVDDQNEINETEKDLSGGNSKLRKLVRYGKEKHGGGDFFDGYCRYGCSQMGVTFPYYYRPFFGYGYPLVGTEGFFPAGYGGNPVTELAANGVIGAPNPGMAGVPNMNMGMGGGVNMGAPPAMPPMSPGMTPGMPPF